MKSNPDLHSLAEPLVVTTQPDGAVVVEKFVPLLLISAEMLSQGPLVETLITVLASNGRATYRITGWSGWRTLIAEKISEQ